MVLGKLGGYMQKNETRHLLIPHRRINSKWTKDFNVRPQAIKIIEENIGSQLFDISLSNLFWIYLLGQKKQKKNKQMGLH